MPESSQKHETQLNAAQGDSGVLRRPEADPDARRNAAAAELQALEQSYRHDNAFDPRILLMMEKQRSKRTEAERQKERDDFEQTAAWTRDTAKELRKPYEMKRQHDLIAMDQRVIAAERVTQQFTDMLTKLAEGDPSKADAWYAKKEAEAADALKIHVREASMFKNAATHPEARVDWTNFESLTRKAEAAERAVAHAQEKLKRLGDKRRYLALLGEINRK